MLFLHGADVVKMRMTIKHIICVAFLASTVSASLASASLITTPVTGSLTINGGSTNYFDPTNGYVPASGYLNSAGTTVPVSQPQVEFGYQDSSNQYSANFTDSQLYIEDQYFGSSGTDTFTMTFTDPSFAGMTFSPSIANFPSALTASLTGDTITVTAPAQTFPANTSYIAVFNVTGSPAPEPATGAVAMGLMSLLSLRRRSRRA